MELIILAAVLIHSDEKKATLVEPPTETTDKVVSGSKQKTKNKKQTQIDTTHWISSEAEISFPILRYHSIAESDGSLLKIPPAEFEAHMNWLKENDYYTLSPEEAKIVLSRKIKPAEKIIWLTFDGGSLDNYQEGFPILKDLELKASINVVQDKLETNTYCNEHDMKEMVNSGYVSIGSHTVHQFDLDTMAFTDQLAELSESKKRLDQTLNQKTMLLSYPNGKYNADSIEAAQEAGYTLALTMEAGLARASDGLYALKRIPVSPGLDGASFGKFIEDYLLYH
ncbi:polysaccharide deacetylase family protein [Vagococcus elongatus]|uniref:polysaccharide deacetylase family protein n=1 Tax=Vagococcus elongatus TaxID=180344 RepID=UPI001FE6DF32|nr:polysaccharide deacetylase family protein [Vagococcus elongatus]